MTTPVPVSWTETDLDALAQAEGRLAVLVAPEGKLDPAGRRLAKLTRGALTRLVEGEGWAKLKTGEGVVLAWPVGVAATSLMVIKLPRRPSAEEARKAGAALAKFKGTDALTLAAGAAGRVADLALGLSLRAYDFLDHKTAASDTPKPVTIMVAKPDEAKAEAAPLMALAEGVFFTRDLVNEPANILTTTDFANRLFAMRGLGLAIEILEEDEMRALGMGALWAWGRGLTARPRSW